MWRSAASAKLLLLRSCSRGGGGVLLFQPTAVLQPRLCHTAATAAAAAASAASFRGRAAETAATEARRLVSQRGAPLSRAWAGAPLAVAGVAAAAGVFAFAPRVACDPSPSSFPSPPPPPRSSSPPPPAFLPSPPRPRMLIKYLKLSALLGSSVVCGLLSFPLTGCALFVGVCVFSCPQPESVWDWLDVRRTEKVAAEGSAVRKLFRAVDPSTAIASVSVMDLHFCVLVEVQFIGEKLTLVGALGEWFLVSRASISAGSPWRNAADTSAEVVTKWVGAVKRAAEDAGVPREWTTWFDTK